MSRAINPESANSTSSGASNRVSRAGKNPGNASDKNLPQDRETVYYFNLREIPPKSNKPNTLQIALQRASSCSTAQQLLRWSKTHRHRRSN